MKNTGMVCIVSIERSGLSDRVISHCKSRNFSGILKSQGRFFAFFGCFPLAGVA